MVFYITTTTTTTFMGGIKLWLEGLGPRPQWAGKDDGTGAAVHVDKEFVNRAKAMLAKVFSCLRPPKTSTPEDHPEDQAEDPATT